MSVEPILTATLAELYIRQGHLEEGKTIYRQLIANEPDNTGYLTRLNELEPEKPFEKPQTKGETMSFREHLERLTNNVEDCLMATIMGVDGIPIDSIKSSNNSEEMDVSNVIVEYAGLISQMQRSGEAMSSGPLHEFFIKTEKFTTLIRPITKEYFLGMTLKSTGNVGKGRYYLRIIAPKLISELS